MFDGSASSSTGIVWLNIFILDTDPIKAAHAQCDKHVVKMTLETAQLLCAAVILNGGTAPYKLTHKSHPSTKWTAASRENFLWLVAHGKALAAEYTFRYDKIHKCQAIIESVEAQAGLIPALGLQPFAFAMPDKYKTDDVVESYRAYYTGDKAAFAKWTRRSKPDWWM